MSKLNFKDENLVVDWISFNAKDLTDLEPIAEHLLGFRFTPKKQTYTIRYALIS
jgi:hypothetical protein